MKNRTMNIILTFIVACLFWSGSAVAADPSVKIGTMSLRTILIQSKAGQEVRKQIEAEIAKYESELKKDQEELKAMDGEVKKKSSVWSEEVRSEKEREFQKKLREFRLKEANAKEDIQQLEKNLMDPVLKDLNEIIIEVAKKRGFSIILEYSEKGPIRPPLLYADETLDVSDLVIKELDSRKSK